MAEINQDTYGDATKITSRNGSEVADSELRNNLRDVSLDLSTASTTGHVDCGNVLSSDALSCANAGFSIHARVYHRTGGTFSQRILNKGTGAGGVGGGGYSLLIDDAASTTAIFVGANGSFDVESFNTSVLPQNAWFDLGVSCDGTSARYYINGNLEATGAFTSLPPATTAGFLIGEWAGGARNFYGKLQDLCVHNAVLTDEQFSLATKGVFQQDSLVGHWPCQDGSGITLTEEINGQDGTLIETATWATETDRYATCSRTISTDLISSEETLASFKYTPSRKTGDVNGRIAFSIDGSAYVNENNVNIDQGAYIYDDTNDWIDIGSTSQTVKAIRFLVKATQTTSESIIDFDAGTHTISTDGSDQITATGFSTPTYYLDGISGDRIITDDTWHSVTIKTATGFTASDLDIGRISAAYFGGSIGRIVLYDTEPTDAMVWDEYAYNIDANSANIVGDWDFNGNATDSSGNGNNGTVSGAVNTTDWAQLMPIGRSLIESTEVPVFDNTNDWVDVGDTTSASIKSISFDINLDEATSESIMDLDAGTHTISTDGSDQITATGFTTPTYYVDGVSGGRVVTNGGWHKVLITTATGIDVDDLDFGRIASAYMGGKIANIAMWTDVRTSGEALTDFENGWIDTTDGAIAHYWGMAGVYTDSVGSADGTNQGSTMTDDLLRPVATNAQQTIDISALGTTSIFNYRTYFNSLDTDRTFALDEISLFGAGGFLAQFIMY